MHFDPGFQERLGALFQWRRDVRRFSSDPVSKSQLMEILHQAVQAPSVGLSEPWRFIHVESDILRAKAVANFEAANQQALAGYHGEDATLYARLKLSGMREAPVQLAVFCAEETPKGKGLGVATMPQMRRYSVVCAVMQLWLAARAQGLGMGWVSILDPQGITTMLETPPDWTLIAWLCLGKPAEEHLDPELERKGWESRAGLDPYFFTR